MVSTPLKNISQIGNLPKIVVKIKNLWNHHLEMYVGFKGCPPLFWGISPEKTNIFNTKIDALVRCLSFQLLVMFAVQPLVVWGLSMYIYRWVLGVKYCFLQATKPFRCLQVCNLQVPQEIRTQLRATVVNWDKTGALGWWVGVGGSRPSFLVLFFISMCWK